MRSVTVWRSFLVLVNNHDLGGGGGHSGEDGWQAVPTRVARFDC